MLNKFKEWARENGWNIFPAKDITDLPDFVAKDTISPKNGLNSSRGWKSAKMPMQRCDS